MYIDDIGSVDPEFFADFDDMEYDEGAGSQMFGDGAGVFDTYDDVVDDPDLEPEDFAELFNETGEYEEAVEGFGEDEIGLSDSEIQGLREEGLAVALAFGEDLGKNNELLDKVRESKYDLNDNTDKQNMEEAMSLNQALFGGGKKKLRPFEQHVQNYLTGSRLF